MKITAPATSAAEASELIALGAGELYCGLHPKAWQRDYGDDYWLNRRGPGKANIGDLNELARLTEVARVRSVPVFLALNMPFYPPQMFEQVLSLARQAVQKCGVDALIIGDPGLIAAVREECPNVAVHVSSLAAVLNSSSATFFKILGASRIIFPRYMETDDVMEIINKTGRDIEYEFFILNDGCVFEEGYCNVSHALGGAFCHGPWEYNTEKRQENEHSHERSHDDFSRHMDDYRRWTWSVKNCGGGPGPGGFPMGMCGLCALPELKDAGNISLKIVGREAPSEKKKASVALVRKALEYLDNTDNPRKYREMVRRLKNTPDICNSGYACYFR